MNDINAELYYSGRAGKLSKAGSANERMAKCPFHQDDTPSLSLNLITGLWFCHGCHEGGNIVQFEAKLKNTDTKTAYAELCKEFGIDTNTYIDSSLVEQYHNNLMNTQKAIDFLDRSRGIKLDIIRKYRIGLDEETHRLTIPILKGGFVVNIRKYKSGASESKMIGIAGHNDPALFPYENLNSNPILIMEGELDCLLANQLGFKAITVTGGAGTFKDGWINYFIGKDVIICYDIDQAGRKGANTVIEKIKDVAVSIKNIELPIKSPENGDFTDYIITHQFTADDFKQLIEETKDVRIVGEAEPPAMAVNLPESSNAIYYGKYIETAVTIAGKDMEVYNVPLKFKIKCSPTKSQKCAVCALSATKEMTFEVKKNTETILELVGINQFQLMGALRKVSNLSCDKNTIEILDKQSVEEIIAIPEISYNSDTELEYVTRRIFYCGHGIKTNKSYLLKGYNFTHPKDQHSTIVVTKAIATQGTLDPAQITPEIKETLKIFDCAPSKEGITEKLDAIYADFSHNVTHIFGRNDMLLAIDLTYHSVLSFDFFNVYVHKGWVDALILGDTKCGKSKSIEGLNHHYRAGEIVGGDNVSFAGLVGGVQQIGKGWVVTWGKLVLNNGMLIAIDELSSMEKEDIELLSGIRTTGIAEISKIRSAKTQARTRLLCFSNPRTGRKLATYSKGVLAIKELIGKAEDISRFDVAVTVADSEIPQQSIDDNLMHKLVPHTYDSQSCHNLVMWTWTRKKDDIVFMPDTEKAILKYAMDLTETYDSDIPLVTPAEQRIKLARMSIALACRLHSTDKEGNRVLVYPAHVEYIYDYLVQCFNKPSMAYDLFSTYNKSSYKFIEANMEKLSNEFMVLPDWQHLRDLLLRYELIKKSELELQMKYDDGQAKEFFGWCSRNNLMFTNHQAYVKHPLFILMLKNLGKGAPATAPVVEKGSIEESAKNIFNV